MKRILLAAALLLCGAARADEASPLSCRCACPPRAPRAWAAYDWVTFQSRPGWSYCYRNGRKLVAAYDERRQVFYAVGPLGRWAPLPVPDAAKR